MRWFLSMLALAGCAAPENKTAAPGGQEGLEPFTCDARLVQDLIGRPWKPADGDAVMRRARAATLRVAGPNDPVTMDFGPDRLSVQLDAAGRVLSVSCG